MSQDLFKESPLYNYFNWVTNMHIETLLRYNNKILKLEDLIEEKCISKKTIEGNLIQNWQDLTWFWVLGCAEVLRAVFNAASYKEEKINKKDIEELKNILRDADELRIAFAKQEKKGGKHGIRNIDMITYEIPSLNFGVGNKKINRRDLGNKLKKIIDKLKNENPN